MLWNILINELLLTKKSEIMEPRKIKRETIDKCLKVLRVMKFRADNNFVMDVDGIIKKHRTNGAIPYAAKALNYFGINNSNKWVCNKTRFEPINARIVLNYVYNHYQNKDKGESQNALFSQMNEITQSKEDVSTIKNEKYLNLFDKFRKLYPGTKRGNSTEFNDFIKKHKDWKLILPSLYSIIEKQIKYRANIPSGKFIPDWKNLKTWINNRCWEEETSLNDLIIREVKELKGSKKFFYPNNYEFLPPLVQQVKEYCKSEGITNNEVNPYYFHSYYASIGWIVGENEKIMTDWKKVVHEWRDRKNNKVFIKSKSNEYTDQKIKEEAIKRCVFSIRELLDELKKLGFQHDISNCSFKQITEELKKRGYSGNLKKDISF